MILSLVAKLIFAVRQWIINPERRVIQYWRGMLFRAQVVAAGGELRMNPSVQIVHPVRFQGRGRLVLGDQVVLGFRLAGSINAPILLQPRDPGAEIVIGQGTVVVNGCEFIARKSIQIGEDCRIGARSVILDSDFHGIRPGDRGGPGVSRPVVIEDNVWVGTEVMVLKGVRIGRDAVIGARCVVAKDVPMGAIAVGNPMRIVGSAYDQ